MTKWRKKELEEAILLLRYGSPQPRQFHQRIMSLQDIGNNIGRSPTYVRRVCLDHESKVKKLMEPMKQSTRKHKKL